MNLKKKINLVQLSKKEIKSVKAGMPIPSGYVIECDSEHCCGCGCYYAQSGGSSTSANKSANYDNDLYSPT